MQLVELNMHSSIFGHDECLLHVCFVCCHVYADGACGLLSCDEGLWQHLSVVDQCVCVCVCVVCGLLATQSGACQC